MKITGIILCGGKSSRMGFKNKCFLKLGTKSLIEIVIEKLNLFFSDILLVTKDKNPYKWLKQRIVTDIYPERSSLTGIHAGLVSSKTEYNFIVGCDTPLLKPDIIRLILSAIDSQAHIIVPRIGRHFEPLCAIYSKKCIPVIEDMIKRKCYKISTLFEKVPIKIINENKIRRADPHLYSFFNINTPEDYKKILKIYFNIL